MSDGTVNALTYNKKQEICAWHKHITDGEFESVSVIIEFFVDSGLKAEFENPVTSVSGLEHLEGKTVLILADGGVYERTVISGSVSLPYGAEKIIISLPYTFTMETLNIEGENTFGLKKNYSQRGYKSV